ncbi:MAG: hypothetical protein AB8B69_23155 [Chitinophagales bacterium]
MLKPQSLLEKHKILIQKTFKDCCLQQNVHLSEGTQKLIFQKLYLYLQKNWQNALNKYGKFISEKSIITELVRLGCKKLFKNNNAEDIELLQNAADKLVLKYYSIIKHLVYKQNKKGKPISADEQADLIANIQIQLLEKAKSGKLSAQYEGNALFSTYFYKVAYHCMIDEWRKIHRHQSNISQKTSILDKGDVKATNTNQNYEFLVEQHLYRFQTLLHILPPHIQKRFEFTLKVNYRMRLVAADVLKLYAKCSNSVLSEILSYFGKQYHQLAQAKLFVLIGGFLSILEKSPKPVNVPSFRVWFQNSLNKLKKTLFKDFSKKDKKTIDAYFEFLIYKHYKKD